LTTSQNHHITMEYSILRSLRDIRRMTRATAIAVMGEPVWCDSLSRKDWKKYGRFVRKAWICWRRDGVIWR